MPTVAAVLVFVCTCMYPAAAPVSRCVCVAERLYLLLLIFVVGDYICRSKPPSLPSSPSPSRTSQDSRTQARSTYVHSRCPRTARRVCVRLARGGRLSPSCLRARACQCPSVPVLFWLLSSVLDAGPALSVVSIYIQHAVRRRVCIPFAPLRPPPPVFEIPRAMYV